MKAVKTRKTPAKVRLPFTVDWKWLYHAIVIIPPGVSGEPNPIMVSRVTPAEEFPPRPRTKRRRRKA